MQTMGFRQKHHRLFTLLVAFCLYALVSCVDGIILAEFAVHPQREMLDVGSKERIFPARYLNIREEPVEIDALRGARLRGTYAQPMSQDNGSTVILLHGVAADRSSMAGFARLFLANGYRVLLPDSRAQSTSGGAFASYGILEQDDVRRWIDWASSQSPGHCIYGLGESMGAAILLQSVGYDHRFCAAAAESSFATFRQIANIRVGQFTHTGPWMGATLARPMIDAALLYVRLRYDVDLDNANPVQAVARTCTPVLLIHGLSDTNIPSSSSTAIHQAAPQSTQLWLVPNAGHCGASAVNRAQFDDRVLRWFGEHTTPCQ
jgi:hypothetical protein